MNAAQGQLERIHIDEAWEYLIPRMQNNPLVQSALRELVLRFETRLTEASRMMKASDVAERLSVSKATLYRMIARGAFPEPIRVSPRRVAWRASDVEAWIANRVIAGYDKN